MGPQSSRTHVQFSEALLLDKHEPYEVLPWAARLVRVQALQIRLVMLPPP